MNPISKGTSVIYEKPLAKEVQKLVSQNKDALWIVNEFNGNKTSNYLAANGAKTINTTANYPNVELYKKLFEQNYLERDIEFIYNRYAHIKVEITDEKTSLEYLGADGFEIYININDLDKINVTYVVSDKKLDYKKLREIYSEYNAYIYKYID